MDLIVICNVQAGRQAMYTHSWKHHYLNPGFRFYPQMGQLPIVNKYSKKKKKKGIGPPTMLCD